MPRHSRRRAKSEAAHLSLPPVSPPSAFSTSRAPSDFSVNPTSCLSRSAMMARRHNHHAAENNNASTAPAVNMAASKTPPLDPVSSATSDDQQQQQQLPPSPDLGCVPHALSWMRTRASSREEHAPAQPAVSHTPAIYATLSRTHRRRRRDTDANDPHRLSMAAPDAVREPLRQTHSAPGSNANANTPVPAATAAPPLPRTGLRFSRPREALWRPAGVSDEDEHDEQCEKKNCKNVDGPVVQMALYGNRWADDAVVLYTNSVRAELKELTRLMAYVKALWQIGGAIRVRALLGDFERWWNYFSRYTELVLKGFDEIVFAKVNATCGDKWITRKAIIFRKMETARDALSTVDNRMLRLARLDATDGANVAAFMESIAGLVPVLGAALDSLDEHLPPALSAAFRDEEALWPVHAKFVDCLARDRGLGLGWAAAVTLTAWIEDDSARNTFLNSVVRGFRRVPLRRAIAENEHANTASRLQARTAMEKKDALMNEFDLVA